MCHSPSASATPRTRRTFCPTSSRTKGGASTRTSSDNALPLPCCLPLSLVLPRSCCLARARASRSRFLSPARPRSRRCSLAVTQRARCTLLDKLKNKKGHPNNNLVRQAVLPLSRAASRSLSLSLSLSPPLSCASRSCSPPLVADRRRGLRGPEAAPAAREHACVRGVTLAKKWPASLAVREVLVQTAQVAADAAAVARAAVAPLASPSSLPCLSLLRARAHVPVHPCTVRAVTLAKNCRP
jgi:hypothetical protein